MKSNEYITGAKQHTQETYNNVQHRNNIILLGDWNGHMGTERY